MEGPDSKQDQSGGWQTWISGILVAVLVTGALLFAYSKYYENNHVSRPVDILIRLAIAAVAIVVGSAIHNRMRRGRG